jgi:exosome complex exonuclease RRP6
MSKKPRTQKAIRGLFKPQLNFNEKPDNSWIPFIPKLDKATGKPNALTPLPNYEPLIETVRANWTDFAPWKQDNNEKNNNISFVHPYEYEIKKFQYLPAQLSECQEKLYLPLSDTPCQWIDELSELEKLAKRLDDVHEFAVDLEAHSTRSYQGFTCLMQISSRTEDFLIDTLILRDELSILNNVFTNPKVVKIFHGADWDIEWLQKDFGIYIVNMFDTHQAAKELHLPTLSLAYLLKTYCNIDASKQYQLAELLPKDIQGIRTSCKFVPELVEKNLEEIHRLLIQAIQNPLSEFPDDESVQNKRAISSSDTPISIDSTKRTKLIPDS